MAVSLLRASHREHCRVWLQDDLATSNPIRLKEVHTFSTFFYKQLTSWETYVTAITIIITCLDSWNPSAQKGYEKVCKWVKCDIFQKKYLIVPINEDLHWYLAIIYKPEHLMRLNCNDQDGEKCVDQSAKYYI